MWSVICILGLLALVLAPENGEAALSVKVADVGLEFKTLFLNEPFAVEAVLEWEETEGTTVANQVFWETFVNDELVASGSELVNETRMLPNAIACGSGQVSNAGTVDVKVVVRLDADEATNASTSSQAIAKGVSVIPILLILFLAIVTQNVEVSLTFGIFVGACIVTGTISGGFKDTLTTYIVGALADEYHQQVILFTIFLSGLVGMIQKSGGMAGFSNLMLKYSTSRRVAQFCAFISGIIIFFDDYTSCLVAGSSMRPIMDVMMVSREKLAFLVDATSAPIASLSPISSWVGYEVSLIDAEIQQIEGFNRTAYGVFLDSIAYRYYPIFMLVLQILLIAVGREFGPMLIAERKVVVSKRTDGGEGAFKGSKKLQDANEPEPSIPKRAYNMLIPILVLIILCFVILVNTGKENDPEATDFLTIIQSSDSYLALLYGTMGATLITVLFYLVQFQYHGQITFPRLQCNGRGDGPKPLIKFFEQVEAFLTGLAKLFPAVIILTLAWASGSIITDVGCDRLFADLITDDDFDVGYLPTLVFLISMLMALATGTSWGTMSIIFPLVTVPSYVASGGNQVVFDSVIAAVLAGSVAGDHMSPISDTTVLSAMASECDLTRHVVTQAPYALLIVVISMLFGTLPVGTLSYSNGVAILVGTIVTILCVVGLGVPVLHMTGRFDIFTELYLACNKGSSLHQLKKETAQAAANYKNPLEEDDSVSELEEQPKPPPPALVKPNSEALADTTSMPIKTDLTQV